MRATTTTTLVSTLILLGGCSKILKSEKMAQSSGSETILRSAPPPDYGFAGYDVEIYDSGQYYYYGYNEAAFRPLTVADASDPRDTAFVKLNGISQSSDWQNCERRHNGYLNLSEYDLRLDPEFEVCMRNKGYVMSSELGFTSAGALTAQNSGLRSYAQSYGYSAAR